MVPSTYSIYHDCLPYRLEQHDDGRLGPDSQGHQNLLPPLRWVNIERLLWMVSVTVSVKLTSSHAHFVIYYIDKK